jgi:hypothetical protein
MNQTIGGLSVPGILAGIAIIAGVVLLVVYAARRGFVDRELDGTIESTAIPFSGPAPEAEPAARPRALGIAGATLLAVGVVLGVATAVFGLGGGINGTVGDHSDGPGACAQSWNGCPQATQNAPASPTVAP